MRLKPNDGHVNACGVSNQDQTASVSRVSSSRGTWKNLSGSSLIKQTRLDHNDLHPRVSSELLIEDETKYPTVYVSSEPKFSCLYKCSSTEIVLLYFLSN